MSCLVIALAMVIVVVGGSVGVATPPYPGVCRTVSREMPGSNAGGGSAWYELFKHEGVQARELSRPLR